MPRTGSKQLATCISGILLSNLSLVVGWGGFGIYLQPQLLGISVLFAVEIVAASQLESAAAGERWVPRQSWVFLFAPAWLVLNALLASHAKVHGLPWPMLSWSGVLLFGAGLWLRTWSARKLGRFFSLNVTVFPGQQVIMSGPYAFCRHPAYLGSLIQLAGLTLGFEAPVGLLAIALFATVLIGRIRDEEKLLRDTFAFAYDEYRSRVPMLIPKLPNSGGGSHPGAALC